jgi:hypothetical protein
VFLIGTEEKEWAYRAVQICFELHFYIIANEERSIMLSVAIVVFEGAPLFALEA